MTRKEWLTCLSIARSPAFTAIPYLSLDAFSGCALDCKRRAVTQREVASLIVGHCATFGGTWLHAKESEIEFLAKRFDIVG